MQGSNLRPPVCKTDTLAIKQRHYYLPAFIPASLFLASSTSGRPGSAFNFQHSSWLFHVIILSGFSIIQISGCVFPSIVHRVADRP